jgi:hypothetical protein
LPPHGLATFEEQLLVWVKARLKCSPSFALFYEQQNLHPFIF